jgi:ribosomal biogenesis protein LAS1
MFQRAVDLGLPASFVELRHEATHREPPSLVVLRKATQRSLEWLWDNYWGGIDELGDAPPLESDDTASVKRALLDTLLPVSGRSNATAEPLSKKRKRDQDLITAAQLVSICNVSGTGIRILPSVLLDESMLIPAGRM